MSLEFSEKESQAIRATFCPGFTDQQFEVCMTFCRVRNLLPGKHVLFQLRSSKEWDEAAHAKVPVTKIIFITTIDASRLIAQRTGQYGGQAPEQYVYLDADGSPSVISEIPLPKLPLPPSGLTALPREPWAVRTTVYRKDFGQPITSIARFDAYAATYNGANGPQLNEMWARRGPEQLAKCSEMLSLRKAFPEELGGIFIQEEFKPDQDEVAAQSVSPAVAVPQPPPVPKVDQTPAVPTDAPRPNETVKGNAEKLQQAEEIPGVKSRSGDIGQTIGEQLNERRAVAQALVPDLKPASELPAPKKRGRKPKESPDNGQPVSSKPVDEGITQADIDAPLLPEVDQAENQAAAESFVEAASDVVPTADEKKAFAVRIRALTATGRKADDIKKRILELANVTDHNLAPVRFWNQALKEMENPQAKELGAF